MVAWSGRGGPTNQNQNARGGVDRRDVAASSCKVAHSHRKVVASLLDPWPLSEYLFYATRLDGLLRNRDGNSELRGVWEADRLASQGLLGG